jgi:hypothetical protein
LSGEAREVVLQTVDDLERQLRHKKKLTPTRNIAALFLNRNLELMTLDNEFEKLAAAAESSLAAHTAHA